MEVETILLVQVEFNTLCSSMEEVQVVVLAKTNLVMLEPLVLFLF